MDFLDHKLLLEMNTLDGIIAKSAIEKERLAQLEKDGLAESRQDQAKSGLRIMPPRRFRLTELGRKALASFAPSQQP